MKRKVNLVGQNTLTISLPTSWAKINNISKGDELDVLEDKSALVVSKSRRELTGLGTKTLDINSADKFMTRLVSGPYRHGYNKIKINFKDPGVVDKVQSKLDMLHGFELIDQGENYCVLKNIMQGNETELDDIIKRIFMITINMFKESYDAISKKQFERLPNIAKLERMNSRLVDFCKRLLNLYDYEEPQKAKELYYILGMFEEFADDFRDICAVVCDNKLILNNSTLLVLKAASEHFSKIYTCYYDHKKFDKNRQKINSKKILKDIFGAYSKAKKSESIVLAYLQAIILRSHHVIEEIQV
ncbi:phosphate uptake regulator PhoU [Candidatus Woesearchaeota archaeon]|jgi:phosphate uptake regulator|nr:phosphate uptake regulator PhoU [Candidatus Woesearchaeota archaeon]MBT7367437.1 phosphate uptake regulator PhoU [Candidatus Woesearchaeota archaeon]